MYANTILEAINRFHHELTAMRRDIHAHPELGFQEVRTSAIVIKALTALGYERIHALGIAALPAR